MLIREELAYRRVPVANANGLDMLSPTLKYGTDEQQDEHLLGSPYRASWCQGYSEPEAGSDLTHLEDHGQRDAKEYVVTIKIWTGHAVQADWMILLARTDLESEGQQKAQPADGLLDETPGVEIPRSGP